MTTSPMDVTQQIRLYDHAGRPMEHSNMRHGSMESYARADTYRELAAIINHENGTGPFSATNARRPFLNSVWVYACVTMIAQSFSQIPLWFGKKSTTTKGRKKGFQQITSHPMLDLLEQPNSLMTKETFFETWITNLLTGGNVWIYIDEPTSTGIPRSLMVMGISQVRPNREKKTGRLLSWLVRLGSGKEQEVPLDDMIHTKLATPYDLVMGLPPVASMQAQLDADYARTMFDRAFFRNNASPDAVLIYRNGVLSQDQRSAIRESWDEFHQGVEKAGGLAVIGGDFDFKVWGVSHSQSQFIENRSFTREEVASAFHTPILLLNATRGGALTREAMDAAQVSFYDHAVFPNMKRFTTPFNIRIVRKTFPDMMLDFDIDTLPVMTAYLESKSKVLDKLVKNGIPLNEALTMLDISIDPIEGGEKGYLPGNYVPVPALSKITKMVPPSATPNTPPGPRPPSPKQAPTRLNVSAERIVHEIDDNALVIRLKSKIKRILFNLRAESLKNESRENPFNLVSAKRAWVRAVLPIASAAMQDTLERHSGHQGILDHILTLSDSEQDQIFSDLTRFVDKIEFKNPLVMSELERLVARSTEFLDAAWTDITDGCEASQVFRSLNGLARIIAEDTIRWCRNAGIYTTRPDYYRNNPHRCADNYQDRSYRYPGDALASLGEVLECRHVLPIGGIQ